MRINKTLIKIIRGIDKYSPYPLFYSFCMTRVEKKLFDKRIKNSKVYLEFGMGGSTFRALKNSQAKIYSIDSSVEWIGLMREYIFIKYMENKRLFFFHVDIGLTQKWGIPIGNVSKKLFPNYSANVFNLIKKESVDTILIDGRFRVACTLKSILECYKNENLEILIHDFWHRTNYHIVLKYLNEINRAGRLGLFKIKEDIDLNSVKKDYDIYKFIPD